MGIGNSFPLFGQKTLGVRTPYGSWLAPGGRVAAYVGPAGIFEDTYSENLRVTTLNAGLARCRAGKNDSVIVLPGHTENVSTADAFSNLVAGTQIIGAAPFGSTLMPTLNYTVDTASFLLDQPNVLLSGIKFTPGVDSVDRYVVMSGQGAVVRDCFFFNGAGTTDDVDIPLEMASGCSDSIVEDNTFLSIGSAVHTNLILMSGAGVNAFEIRNNYLYGACATTGLINLTGTGVGWRIYDNKLYQITATTPLGIRHTDTGLTGLIYNNLIAFLTDVTVLTAAINAVGVATASVRSMNNFGCDEDSLGGLLVPTATGLE